MSTGQLMSRLEKELLTSEKLKNKDISEIGVSPILRNEALQGRNRNELFINDKSMIRTATLKDQENKSGKFGSESQE